MGEFEHEIVAINWVNLFNSAIDGNPPLSEDTSCFRTLGYFPLYFPTFHYTYLEKGVEKLKDIHPDFLLVNLELKIAFLVEVKGENSVEPIHLSKIDNLLQVPTGEIETLVSEAKEISKVEVEKVYTAIVYRKETIDKCSKSESGMELLQDIMKNHIVMHQSFGDNLIALNPEKIDFDNEIIGVLKEGISLPSTPKKFFYITENPCTKGVIVGIINYIIDQFYSGEDLTEVQITALKLQNDIFKHTSVQRRKCQEALEYLLKKNLCRYIKEAYNFNSAEVDYLIKNYKQILDDLRDFKCPTRPPPPKQKVLEHWSKQ